MSKMLDTRKQKLNSEDERLLNLLKVHFCTYKVHWEVTGNAGQVKNESQCQREELGGWRNRKCGDS